MRERGDQTGPRRSHHQLGQSASSSTFGYFPGDMGDNWNYSGTVTGRRLLLASGGERPRTLHRTAAHFLPPRTTQLQTSPAPDGETCPGAGHPISKPRMEEAGSRRQFSPMCTNLAKPWSLFRVPACVCVCVGVVLLALLPPGGLVNLQSEILSNPQGKNVHLPQRLKRPNAEARVDKLTQSSASKGK